MTSVPPSTPLLQGPLQAPQTPVAVVPDPPEALLKLAPGSRIEGLVLAQAARGSAQVRTDAGTLDLRTSIPLAKGAVLALVLKAVTPQVQVQIAAVGRASPDSVAPPPADAGPGFGRATLSPQSVLPGTTIEPAGFAVGTRLIATLSRPALSISGIVGQLTSPAGPSELAAEAPSILPSGSRFVLRVVAVQPATTVTHIALAASIEPSALTAGQTLNATAIGTNSTGQTILRTAVGVLTLATAAALPRGTVLTVEIAGAPRMPLATPAGAPPPKPSIPLFGEGGLRWSRWPALAEMLEALHAADPAAARQLIEAVVPRPDSRLVTAVLFFLSALRGGDVRGWLGDAVARGLDRVRPDLSARLADDFRQLARAADEPVSRDWRVTHVPLFTGTEIEMIRLWTRHHGDSTDDGDTRQRLDQRFVVDVSLSRLGRLQLDGLVRDSGRGLDLIVRSEYSLPPTMRDHIRTLFADTNAVIGLTGGIGFQATPPDFVDVIAEPFSVHHDGVVV